MMKKELKRILICFTAAALFLMLSAVSLQAASVKAYHWADDPAVKTGGAWFRCATHWDTVDGEEILFYSIEMSKTSPTTGFTTLIESADLNGGFATDGKTIYYLEKNLFKSYVIKTGKTKVIKKLKAADGIYYEFHGFFKKKIWLIARERVCIAPALYSYNPKTKKFKTEKKKFLCFTAAAPTRYMVIVEKKAALSEKAGATYKLKVYDKNTGKSTLITKKGIPVRSAAGGGGTSEYAGMGKKFAYGEYNKKKKAWQIKEYKTDKKKTYVLKTLKKGEKLVGILWLGDRVHYYLSTDEGGAFNADHMVKLK